MAKSSKQTFETHAEKLRNLHARKVHELIAFTAFLERDTFGKDWREYFAEVLENEEMELFDQEKVAAGWKKILRSHHNGFQIVFYHDSTGRITTCIVGELDDED